MPVPHNWYATNKRISSPNVMRTRPTAPITVRTGREATSGLLPRLVPRERFAQVRERFVHSSCLEAATRGEAHGGLRAPRCSPAIRRVPPGSVPGPGRRRPRCRGGRRFGSLPPGRPPGGRPAACPRPGAPPATRGGGGGPGRPAQPAGRAAAGRAVLDAVVGAAPDEDRTVILASHELGRTRALAGREVVLAGGVAHFGVAEPPRSQAVDATTAEEEVRAG